MKFNRLLLTSLLLFLLASPAFSQLQLAKIKYQGLALFDTIPTFPGGDTALANYVNNYFKIPDTAKTCGITGVAYITFEVEANGHIMEIGPVKVNANSPYQKEGYYKEKCMLPLTDAMTKLLTGMVNEMPRWNPAYSKFGATKRCKITLPIQF